MPFQPGQSGNPSGRPPLDPEVKHVRELAKAYTPQALEALVQITTAGQSESARVAGAKELLDRAWGKSTQPVEHAGEVTLRHEDALDQLR